MGFSRQEYWSGLPFPSPALQVRYYYFIYKGCVICPGFPGGASGKEPICQCRKCKRCGFNPWVRKSPWRKAWQQSLVFLPGESHGRRSLVNCGPQGLKQSDVTSNLAHSLARSHNSLGRADHKEQTWNWNPDHLDSQALAQFIVLHQQRWFSSMTYLGCRAEDGWLRKSDRSRVAIIIWEEMCIWCVCERQKETRERRRRLRGGEGRKRKGSMQNACTASQSISASMWPLYKAFLVVIIISPFQTSACLPPAMMETYTPPPGGQLRHLLQLSNKLVCKSGVGI